MDLVQLLADEGLADSAALKFASDVAEKEGRALAGVIVDAALVAEDALADSLAKAVGTVVIDVEQGELDADAVQLVNDVTARRYLAIVVSTDPSGTSVRAAFANPLDDEAVRAVREQTGLEVQPLVATVSGVRAAIDRAYARRTTQVVRAVALRPELAPEITRKVGGPRPTTKRPPDGAPPREGTSPLHRLEQDATPEQRHEALVLALIEAGLITRADYVEALRRLLGRR